MASTSTSSAYHYIRSVQTSFTTTRQRAASVSDSSSLSSSSHNASYLHTYVSLSPSSRPSRARACSVLATIEANSTQLPIGSGRKRLPCLPAASTSSLTSLKSDPFIYEFPSYSGGSDGQLPLLFTSTSTNHSYILHVPRTATSAPPAIPSPAPSLNPTLPSRVESARDARAKLVAGILLHRVYAVGRPMRFSRRAVGREKKGYVRSGLSSVVSVAA